MLKPLRHHSAFRFLAASGGFALFVFVGSAWVGLVRFLPGEVSRQVATAVLGGIFALVYIVLLISRVRRIWAGPKRVWPELLFMTGNLALLLIAFAFVYQQFGLIDNTGPEQAVTHRLDTCLYYSVVTFTTLGYGDFYPRGIGRAMAGLEAFIGYVVLGLLVSTVSTLLSPKKRQQQAEEDEQPRWQQEAEAGADAESQAQAEDGRTAPPPQPTRNR